MSVARWWLTTWLAAVLALGAGCDWSLHRMADKEARPVASPPAGAVALGDDGATPVPGITRELIARGQDRFDRTCAACHGVLGDGDSVVAYAMAGRKPRSLVDADAVALSDARIARAMELGYGAMPAMAEVLPAPDRFAVLQFVRALQHREVALSALAPAERAEAQRWLP